MPTQDEIIEQQMEKARVPYSAWRRYLEFLQKVRNAISDPDFELSQQQKDTLLAKHQALLQDAKDKSQEV